MVSIRGKDDIDDDCYFFLQCQINTYKTKHFDKVCVISYDFDPNNYVLEIGK